MTINGPKTYCRRPEEIRALQWTGGSENALAIGDFTKSRTQVGEGRLPRLSIFQTDGYEIELEIGDWITTRQDGGHCRVPAGIFDRLFEAVEAEQRP